MITIFPPFQTLFTYPSFPAFLSYYLETPTRIPVSLANFLTPEGTPDLCYHTLVDTTTE